MVRQTTSSQTHGECPVGPVGSDDAIAPGKNGAEATGEAAKVEHFQIHALKHLDLGAS